MSAEDNRSGVRRRARALSMVVALAATALPLVATAAPAGAATCGTTLTPVGKVNFQPGGAPVPTGFVKEPGNKYTATTKRGFVAQGSLTPVSLVGQAVDRNIYTAQENDTLIRLQVSGKPTGRYRYDVPNGRYEVQVALGDPKVETASMNMKVEGVAAVTAFKPTTATRMVKATVCVDVTDGNLLFDAGGGTNTKFQWISVSRAADTAPEPRTVVEVDPAGGSTGVSRSTSITLTLSHAVDRNTVGTSTVKLLGPDGAQVAGNYNSDGAGGVAGFTPAAALAANTTYTIQTTSGLKDESGVAFEPFSSTFTTGTQGVESANVNFDRVRFADINGPTVVTFGPDGKLYVGTNIGEIFRFTLNADGTPAGAPERFVPFGEYTKLIIGLAFAPGSTASDLKLYVSNNALGFGDQIPNYSGAVSLVTGTSTGPLTLARDVITGLPRSAKDHMTNSIEFGPDGRLYITQGSQSGYGAPDDPWGNRPEVPLAATILVADVTAAGFPSTVDANTSTGYDHAAAGAPVKVHADGLRNAYDLAWTGDGRLWSAVNEAARGDIPANPTTGQAEIVGAAGGPDFLAQVQAGKYYGHPNPSTGTYVLNGGNPTAGVDPFERTEYVVGTQPETRYVRPALDLGMHRSPNGMDLYRAGTFGGAIQGNLLVTEYSGGDDIIAIDPNALAGGPRQVASGFFNPLDLRVDQASGRIYVAEYGSDPEGQGGRITLLVPNAGTRITKVARVNFQPGASAVPEGYTTDTGLGYDAARGSGWVTAGTTTPADLSAQTRDRGVLDDRNQLQDTLIHMQGSVKGDWRMAVPNGTYDVRVSVGDPNNSYDSTHRIVVEGTVAIAPFTPSGQDKFRINLVRVSVTDGFVDVKATGGTNTKLNFVDVDRVETTGGDPFTIETPVDQFGLDTRLVFSSMNHEPSEVETFTIRNAGATPLQVTNLIKGGTHASQFALAAGQPTAFTVPAGGTAQVGLQLTSTTFGKRFATLDVVTSAGTKTVKLRGYDHSRPAFSGGVEPSLQDLVDTFGFPVQTGVTGPNQAKTRDAIGDEVLGAYFTKLDPAKPVTLVPLARYVAPTTSTNVSSATGSTPLNSNGQRREYGFADDVLDDPATAETDETVFNQNQKVLPDTVGSTTLAVGSAPFGLHGNFANYADDAFNPDSTTGEPYRNLRIYPAKDSTGAAIPGAYIVGVDIKVDPTKNYDYQDQIMFLTNAKPWSTSTAAKPGATSLDLGFGAAAGGVADKDGQGTGFTSVQANAAGNQHVPALLDLDAAAGTLRVTSDAGKSSGASNDQRNALETTFDGQTGFTVEAVLLDPAADLTGAFQQKAVWFGPNQDNYMKLEIEQRNDPGAEGAYMTLFKEIGGAGAAASKLKLVNPASIRRLVVRLKADTGTGVVTGSWSIDGGAFQSLPTFTIPLANRAAFFSASAKAGVLTSHTAAAGAPANTPVVAVYDRFRIV